jgi:hypothetical protein
MKLSNSSSSNNKSSNGNGNEDGISGISALVQNALDILRVIEPPTEEGEGENAIEQENFLFQLDAGNSADNCDDEEEDAGDDEDEDDEEESVPVAGSRKRLLTSAQAKASKRPKTAVSSTSAKGKTSSRARARRPLSEQLLDYECHKREFSKAWMLLFSLPLTRRQQKLALKHLPDNVIPHLTQPLLLADYVVTAFDAGGVVAVLALETLFQIIVLYNLDYPNFFAAMYQLCSEEVFNAKYRGKFMQLLHAALKSTNLPAYVAAAFIKKLTHLSLRVPGPCAPFCVTQAMWLLKNHPKCIALIHSKDKAAQSNTAAASKAEDQADTFKFHLPLDTCNALSSSLYEATALQQHYVREVSTLAKALQQNPTSTESGPKATKVDVAKYMGFNYRDMIEEGLKQSRKFSAMAHKEPKGGVYVLSGQIGKCFGSSR